MNKIYEIREQIKAIYNAYSLFINPILKFILTLSALLILNSKIGYMNILTNIAVVMVIALISVFLPVTGTALILSVVIAGNLYGLSLIAAAVVLFIFVLMYLVFFRFTPRYAIVLIIVPVLMFIGLPYVVPIIGALVSTPIIIIPIVLALIVYFILSTISMNAAELLILSKEDPITMVKVMLLDALKNEALIVLIVAVVAVVVAVYVVRRLSIDYAPYIAIAAGVLLNLVIMLVGSIRFDLAPHMTLVSIIVGSLLSALISVIAHFFIITVDYARTEFVQYEDDDYYYYVKAIPKIKVSAPEISVKRINAQKAKRIKRDEN